MRKRVHVFYSGSVQGVGFRYTARGITSRFGISGWVRNLYDGRVELEAEAEEEDLKKSLDAISAAFKGYIRNADMEWSEAAGEFTEFKIRF